MIIKLGSTGNDVKLIQQAVGATVDGIFGPKTEEYVKIWQKKNRLEPDGIFGPNSWAILNSLNNNSTNLESRIIKNPISTHISKSPNREIKYIVIHFTAGGSSKPGAAMATRNVFLNRKASADFCVDDRDIVQINPDLKHYYCWAVGDGNGKYGITNKNSINIEICSNLKKGYSAKYANHDGWYFTKESINSTLSLVKYLMNKFNIPKNNVVRHYDASRKLCPGVIGWNTEKIRNQDTGKLSEMSNNDFEWKKFKSQL